MAHVSELTYSPVGGTRTGVKPPGFRHLYHRTPLGRGEALFRQAGEHVVSFRMHRSFTTLTGAPRAAEGERIVVALGPLHVPCQIVWTSDTPSLIGFGYGTLPGHQATGEEAFMVERDDRDRVWFVVSAYSRPARFPMKALGPLSVIFQHAYARLCGRALKRLCTVKS
ncbi:DUF1990 family protein [Actinoplanes sp. URMC 104]|uniref:DUF1990 family protein n=1 Tax=Actinoplanes sp. URMC 104 TaxID=3423409 RepID=UPI003F1D9718